MPRYRVMLEYDGGPFVGWQAQANGPSVQSLLEVAIHAMTGEAVRVHGAGRTDSGVHALGQVAHFDLARNWGHETLRDGLNRHLRPAPVALLQVVETESTFHARFDAIARHYRYRIVNRRSPLTLDRGRAWQVMRPLDTAAMTEAAQELVGHHDFTTFRSSQCQAASPVKTLDRLGVDREGDEIRIHASARSFLHNQVRSLVGTLKLVGEGRWTRAHVRAALQARNRAACGPVAPPDGLYLVAVNYRDPTNSSSAVDAGADAP